MGASSSGKLNHEEDDGSEDEEEENQIDGMLTSTWEPRNHGHSPGDKRGLIKFYRAAGGEKWRTRTSWLKQSPVGMWYGVSVESRNGEKMVTQLSLHHNKVRGDFQKSAIEFSKIIHLEVLNLGHNKLKGKIPTELSMVNKLKDLILNDNRLTGPVPEFLSKMPRLKKVDLASNELSGELGHTLPVYFARNNLLETFDVNNNDLNGVISEEWGAIRSLQELGLGGNKFTGDIPDELCKLNNLRRLDLHENKLDTEIPDGMSNMTALKQLRLHGNTLIEGYLPLELMQIGRLNVLSLHFEKNQD